MNSYPPLKSLVFLDSVMRNSSFSAAAAELCVTPGAVGQQIQKLEAWLGLPLFVRQVRQLSPTPDGLAYWQQIQPALARIADASRRVRHQRSRSVALSMPPTFAAKWFPRRMAGFLTRHPDIALHLNSTTTLVEFERDGIDLAIRYFDGHAPDLETTLLHTDEARLYCQPGYAAAIGLAQPEHIARATLLTTTMHPHWPTWLARFTPLSAAQIEHLPQIRFDQGVMAIEAAKQGQGLVLTSPLLVEEELAQGGLYAPFDHALPLSAGYYVIHPRALPLRPAALALKNWLIEVAAQPGPANRMHLK